MGHYIEYLMFSLMNSGVKAGWVRVGFGVLGKSGLLIEVGIFRAASGYLIALQASQPQPYYRIQFGLGLGRWILKPIFSIKVQPPKPNLYTMSFARCS
ncbi:MAG: hypothetical protein JSV98_02485 [candidate division WOR-3 bacterium]|nr:MAG: hypothetical protein JSV98_02485 [candidate division WOR-3 bacterium]